MRRVRMRDALSRCMAQGGARVEYCLVSEISWGRGLPDDQTRFGEQQRTYADSYRLAEQLSKTYTRPRVTHNAESAAGEFYIGQNQIIV